MKKSELRKIIKEIIKEQVTSNARAIFYAPACQSNSGPPFNYYTISGPCTSTGCPTSTITTSNGQTYSTNKPYGCTFGLISSGCVTINGQVPQIGDIFETNGDGYNRLGFNNTRVVCGFQDANFNISQIDTGYNGCNQGSNQGLIDRSSSNLSSCNSTPGVYFDSSPPSSGCDQSAWSNYSNWSTNWVNLGPFNSPNPNQPCNFICNKIQDFTNNLVGAGPVQTNILNCKLQVAQQQEQIHNCNC
jgi:hypothetical protein